MPKPQQPELRRSELGATDDDSAKSKAATSAPSSTGNSGPVPEDNQPGHHPDVEQDQPEASDFAARLGITEPE
ncbi:MAG: hypothetical protein JWL70_2287 [Acidimicrobiia bacterium]|nr:hypothetical protein [Acidimicrobiia bacterium]